METLNETMIAKEEIGKLHFDHHEVLKSPEAIQRRKEDLERAMILGNTSHSKVKIEFVSKDGTHCVETTVWHASDADVALKGGAIIPLCCITKV
ncbi:MAG: hypothetical protein EOP53_21210, partial [Sphingobacteriales bacterium]